MSLLLAVYAVWMSRRLARSVLIYRLLWGLITGAGAYVVYGATWWSLSQWTGVTLFPFLVIPVAAAASLVPLMWLHITE